MPSVLTQRAMVSSQTAAAFVRRDIDLALKLGLVELAEIHKTFESSQSSHDDEDDDKLQSFHNTLLIVVQCFGLLGRANDGLSYLVQWFGGIDKIPPLFILVWLLSSIRDHNDPTSSSKKSIKANDNKASYRTDWDSAGIISPLMDWLNSQRWCPDNEKLIEKIITTTITKLLIPLDRNADAEALLHNTSLLSDSRKKAVFDDQFPVVTEESSRERDEIVDSGALIRTVNEIKHVPNARPLSKPRERSLIEHFQNLPSLLRSLIMMTFSHSERAAKSLILQIHKASLSSDSYRNFHISNERLTKQARVMLTGAGFCLLLLLPKLRHRILPNKSNDLEMQTNGLHWLIAELRWVMKESIGGLI